MRLLIKGGQVIDPGKNINTKQDILIENGRIAAMERSIETEADQVIDAREKVVCPGFIDIHVHLREPGFEYKEDIATGTRAAAVGGFTTVCCMPNTRPVIDNYAVASFVREKAKTTGLVNVLPIGAITKKQEGQEISEIADLIRAGCVAISDDGRPVSRADVMLNAMEYSKMFGLPILSHCEDLDLSRDGQMHLGYYSTILGLRGVPAEAEEVMVARDILLSRLAEAHLHICHASSRGTLEMVRRAKEEGLMVTCEVTPHHLALTDEMVEGYNTNAKVNPPLRSQEHREALKEALQAGVIDCIATDHAPHHRDSKDCEFSLATSGISGLETAVPVVMDRLVKTGVISLNKMVELFTSGPARVLGLNKGHLSLGELADITIIDPHKEKKVETRTFYSKGKNNPFQGMKLKGWPYMTIVGGIIVAEDGKISNIR